MSLPDCLMLAALCASTPLACSQIVRVLHFSDSKPFQMGKVTSRRIVQPDTGAKLLTLNYSFSQPGSEFSQHVHDYSDDTILILQGKADLRQGDTRTAFHAGQCAFVPAGQIHGTITTAPDTIMISFQVPPDLVLYTGVRDSSRPGAAPPKGVITPGAVKFIDFSNQNSVFVSPKMGAKRATAAYRQLGLGDSLHMSLGQNSEGLVFVWKGSIRARAGQQDLMVNEKDTLFLSGRVQLDVSNPRDESAILIQIETPARE